MNRQGRKTTLFVRRLRAHAASLYLRGLSCYSSVTMFDILVYLYETYYRPEACPEPAALAWPAHQVLTCAHAHGLACWGLAGSIAAVGDVAGFEPTVRAGRALGFTGSVCIHPRQVPIVNRGFSPSSEELAWAERVVAADEAASRAGLGAVLLDGRMIDRPIVQRARRWLRLTP